MLLIRQAQIAAFAAERRRRFEIDLADRAERERAEAIAGRDREWLLALVHAAVTRAAAQGIRLESDVRVFVDVAIRWGIDFDTRLPWAAAVLAETWRTPFDRTSRLAALSALYELRGDGG